MQYLLTEEEYKNLTDDSPSSELEKLKEEALEVRASIQKFIKNSEVTIGKEPQYAYDDVIYIRIPYHKLPPILKDAVNLMIRP